MPTQRQLNNAAFVIFRGSVFCMDTAKPKAKSHGRHNDWPKRRPARFAAENTRELCGANHRLDPHGAPYHTPPKPRPRRKRHRPPTGSDRSLLALHREPAHPRPRRPAGAAAAGSDGGQVPVSTQRHPFHAPPRSTVVRCLRPAPDSKVGSSKFGVGIFIG